MYFRIIVLIKKSSYVPREYTYMTQLFLNTIILLKSALCINQHCKCQIKSFI